MPHFAGWAIESRSKLETPHQGFARKLRVTLEGAGTSKKNNPYEGKGERIEKNLNEAQGN